MHVSIKRFIDSEYGLISDKEEKFEVEGACYYNRCFEVDNTIIARFLENKFGKRVLLVCAEGLTPKITPYIPEITMNSKMNPTRVYKIPQVRNTSALYHTFDKDGVISLLYDRLDKLSGDMLKNRTVYRCNQYMKMYTTLDKLTREVWGDIDIEPRFIEEAGKCTKHLELVFNEVDDFMSKHTYRELVDIAFFNGECDELNIDENFRSLLRSAMNTSGDLAFLKVMEDGNTYSPDLDADGNYRFVMSNDDSIALTNNFLAGKLKHGQKYGKFTIMSKSHGFVKISCNKYSPEMLEVIHEDSLKFKEGLN